MAGLENVEIPEPFIITTGGQEEQFIVAERDKFFMTVRTVIGMAATRWDFMFRVGEYQLNHSDHHPTDHRIHQLLWEGEVPVAEVTDRRDALNRHLVMFAAFSKLPTPTLAQMEDMLAVSEDQSSD